MAEKVRPEERNEADTGVALHVPERFVPCAGWSLAAAAVYPENGSAATVAARASPGTQSRAAARDKRPTMVAEGVRRSEFMVMMGGRAI